MCYVWASGKAEVMCYGAKPWSSTSTGSLSNEARFRFIIIRNKICGLGDLAVHTQGQSQNQNYVYESGRYKQQQA